MTDHYDTIDAKIDQPYSDDELHEIARVLGIEQFTDPIRDKLESAARSYLVEWETERPPKADECWLYPPRSVRRAAYEKVAKTARELKEALEAPGFSRAFERRFPEEKEDWPEVGREQLEALEKAAEKAATKVPKTGADPRVARRNFIKRLASVFKEVTGRIPARSHDPVATEDTGLFLELVKKCLGPLTPERAEGGVEDDVRLVLRAITSAEHS